MAYQTGKLLAVKLWHKDGERIAPPDPGEALDGAECITWWFRSMRTGDLDTFSTDANSRRTDVLRRGLLDLTDHIEGLADGDGNEITELTEDNFDSIDLWIVLALDIELGRRMRAMQDAVGESETRSDS